MNIEFGKSKPWTKRFIAVAAHAIRQVHNDFILWSIGSPGFKENRHQLLNDSIGIEFADERTVCSYISQQLLSSSIFQGDFESEKDDKGNDILVGRYYKINREYQYNFLEKKVDKETCQEVEKQTVATTDFFIQRYVPNALNMIPYKNVHGIQAAAYIEAKRAARITYKDLSNVEYENTDKSKYQLQAQEIGKKDISKLKKEQKYIKNNPIEQYNELYPYILVWGYEDITPKAFFELIEPNTDIDKLEIHECVYLCLNSEYAKNIEALQKAHSPQKLKYCWIALAEIKFK